MRMDGSTLMLWTLGRKSGDGSKKVDGFKVSLVDSRRGLKGGGSTGNRSSRGHERRVR